MNYATKAWLRTQLAQPFKPFIEQWRDHSSAPSERFLDLYINSQLLGHADRQHIDTITQAFEKGKLLYKQTPLGLECESQGNTNDLTQSLEIVAGSLRQSGLVPGWRNEQQLLLDPQGKVLGQAERALFKTLGFKSRAVHVHVQSHQGLIWTGVRAQSKHENPGMLDNLAAGGISAAETVERTLWRELYEEAGLTAEDFTWIKPLPPCELVLNRAMLYGGWHCETMIMFHGELKPGRSPENRDGEVSAFQLMSPESCIDAVNAWQFTPDAGLCTALALSDPEYKRKD